MLSPLLFTLLTHDCTAKFSSNLIIKFANDTSVVGLISSNDETHNREEVAQLAEWCGANNMSLNVEKTKEVVMDFRRNSVDHPPLTIDSLTVERVSSTKFLGVHITEDLTWTTNTMSLLKKAQQRLHYLRRLKRASPTHCIRGANLSPFCEIRRFHLEIGHSRELCRSVQKKCGVGGFVIVVAYGAFT